METTESPAMSEEDSSAEEFNEKVDIGALAVYSGIIQSVIRRCNGGWR